MPIMNAGLRSSSTSNSRRSVLRRFLMAGATAPTVTGRCSDDVVRGAHTSSVRRTRGFSQLTSRSAMSVTIR